MLPLWERMGTFRGNERGFRPHTAIIEILERYRHGRCRRECARLASDADQLILFKGSRVLSGADCDGEPSPVCGREYDSMPVR